MKNDISLVKVVSDIKFNKKVQPIELNTESIDDNEELVLSGWGRTRYPGDYPDKLMFVNLKSFNLETCKVMHEGSGHDIVESQICTHAPPGQGACHGDSGGPLVYRGKVAGIVSWGKPCALGYPDVFTRVSSFIDWIQSHIDKI